MLYDDGRILDHSFCQATAEINRERNKILGSSEERERSDRRDGGYKHFEEVFVVLQPKMSFMISIECCNGIFSISSLEEHSHSVSLTVSMKSFSASAR